MLFIWVTENWKSSQIVMNSDAKTSDLVQVLTLLKKSEEFLFLRNKKSHTHQEKKNKNNFTFLSLFCLHQTSKNKKITGNIIHNSREMILLCRWAVWVISLSTLTLTGHEDKIQNKLTKFLKTCNKLTKIHINNIMAKNTNSKI